ncbi:ATPase [Paenibacillus sp. 32O-W]|uniref:Activator of HSP90 ATPase n=1 Tax=Paenibacillus cisolokensis TaxID=1658519 RepID=A0ABQ4N351_9BACL|nr:MULTISPECIES: SRPBCC domain-containing protein [Paenibacillus]ALS28129.1 ATPase [Paenibacillus sp. 32O-W]GIQ62576.1 activator of HSP90 ATPase [Paenibacillus cisolokensis]
MNSTTNKLVSKVEGRELVLERVFDAPRELVFEAFAKAEHLMRWFGTKGWPLTVCNIDFRPGGIWHYCMKCVDESQEYFGQESWGRAVFNEIVEPERIVYTDAFSDAEGNVNENMPVARVTLDFVKHDGKTKLISRTQYATEEGLKAVLDMGVIQGINETWNSLADFLADLQNK